MSKLLTTGLLLLLTTNGCSWGVTRVELKRHADGVYTGYFVSGKEYRNFYLKAEGGDAPAIEVRAGDVAAFEGQKIAADTVGKIAEGVAAGAKRGFAP